MKAVLCRKYGGPEVLDLRDIPAPEPKDDEYLVRIRASAVTMSDIYIRSSHVNPALLVPFRLAIGIFRPRQPIIGIVFSGEVEKVGSGTSRFKVGDQVYGLTGFSLATYAEYKCMKDEDSKNRGCAALKPSNISHEEATAAAYGGLLGFQALEDGSAKEGENICIYGASGTSGVMALQQAKALGARVTAVCGPNNLDFVRTLGADKVLDYTDDASINAIEEYDLVVDCVGKSRKSNLRTALESLPASRTRQSSIDDGDLILSSERLQRIRAQVEAGRVKPILDRSYPLEEIRAAHAYVEGRHKRGGVAITI